MFTQDRLDRQKLKPVVAHGGMGEIRFRRLAGAHDFAGGCNFIDHAVIPPGCTIGLHQHASTEEELYLILAGEGWMQQGERQWAVSAGDLIRNPPGGLHGLKNTGQIPLEIFVFELSVARLEGVA